MFCILHFEAVQGLKINLAKSELVHVGLCHRNVEGLDRILGCRVSSLPMKSLGLPLGASFKVESIRDDIIEVIVPVTKGTGLP
jgi:hypothetical protein